MAPDPVFRTATAVVPIYDGETSLARCLESLTSQDEALGQIILVDDGSRDGSSRIIETFAAADGRVEMVKHETNLGLARTLNDGIARARGDGVLILQQDCELLGNDWVRRALRALEQDAPCCVSGAPVYSLGEMNRTQIAFALLRDHLVRPGALEDVSFSEFKCDLIPTAALSQVQFDPMFRISGEDQVLSHRLHEMGYRLLRYRELSYTQGYGNCTTLGQLLKREAVYGKGEAGALLRTGLGIASESASSPMGRGRLRNRGFAVLDVVGWAGLAVIAGLQGLSILLVFPLALVGARVADVALRRRSADRRYSIPGSLVLRAIIVAPPADYVYAASMVAGFFSYFGSRQV